jgi:hypothetical protein
MVPKHYPDFDFEYYAVPFVPLHAGVVDHETLMDFDRETCRTFKQFRRPVHHAELDPIGHTSPPGQILVTEINPGIRMRLFIG